MGRSGHVTLRIALAVLAIGGGWVAVADETVGAWSRWRGRDAAGQGGEASFPVTWSADAWAWKADLPGIGHASPVIWQGQIFTASAESTSTSTSRSRAASMRWSRPPVSYCAANNA